VELPAKKKEPPKGPYLEVQLTDGTQLKCQVFALRGKNAEVRLFNGMTLQFPAAYLHHVLGEAQNDKNRAEFEQWAAKRLGQDVLRFQSNKGDDIVTLEVFIGDADEKGETLQFKYEGETRAMSFQRVRGLIYSRKPDEKMPATLCQVYDAFENVFPAGKVQSTAEGYQLTTPAGLKVELGRPLVQRFDFSLGKIQYLSDMKPLRVDETPILADLWRYRRDKNLEGGPLALGRKTYSKGLAVHSRTVLEYDVKGFNLFRCVLGIDDLVTGPAHAVVRIDGDGKELFNAAVTSKDKPREVELKLDGVSRLRLTVDYGEDLDLGDHVLFADARITK
jgi:hypothetical protein